MAGRINKNWEMFDKDQWNISDVTDGNYTSFVYIIEFPETGEFYYGKKMIYQKVKSTDNLNKAILCKARLPKNRRDLFNVLQDLVAMLGNR